MIEVFNKARKDLYYPPIGIQIDKGFECKLKFGRRHKLVVGRNLLNLPKEVLLGIFHHELNHWAKHPFDLKTVILEEYWLKEFKAVKLIRNTFDDVIVNLDLIFNKGLETISKTYTFFPVSNKLDALLRAYYEEITGLNFGKIEIEFGGKLDKLLKIDFLNTKRLRMNVTRFARIVEDLIEEIELPFAYFSFRDFPISEIERSIGEIAREFELKEFDGVLRYLKISKGSKIAEFEKSDIRWYYERARRHSINIQSAFRTGSIYPNEIKDYEIDDQIDFYSPIESYGKVIPGIAKKYDTSEFEATKTSIPDAVIIIDSSASMRHPKDVSYAVLGAFVIAKNYIDNNARVGVINFSNKNIELKPRRDKSVYEYLRFYQGGGTTIEVEKLERYFNTVGYNKDVILITDAGIENIEEVEDLLEKLNAILIWVRSDVKDLKDYVDRYERLKKKLDVIEIEDEKDIPKIALKRFRTYEN
ncbi:hypothetical protein DRO97_05790 [Archaeoglobales archaeon]|nr:MAG: hypothetical protein DRO97_05790 [Archaeoglobales archaeon]